MALLPNKANTENNNESMADRTPIPAGDYVAQIIKSEMKATKAKTGHYLSLHFKIIHGDHINKLVFTNLNLDNPNAIAVEIAVKELNSICQALDLIGVEDSAELHDKPLVISVKIEPGDAQYPPSNAITGYDSAAGFSAETEKVQDPSKEKALTPESENPAPKEKKKLPWEK